MGTHSLTHSVYTVYERSRDFVLWFMIPFYITVLLSHPFGGSCLLLRYSSNFLAPGTKPFVPWPWLSSLPLSCHSSASTSVHLLFGLLRNDCYLSFKVKIRSSVTSSWLLDGFFWDLPGWVKTRSACLQGSFLGALPALSSHDLSYLIQGQTIFNFAPSIQQSAQHSNSSISVWKKSWSVALPRN